MSLLIHETLCERANFKLLRTIFSSRIRSEHWKDFYFFSPPLTAWGKRREKKTKPKLKKAIMTVRPLSFISLHPRQLHGFKWVIRCSCTVGYYKNWRRNLHLIIFIRRFTGSKCPSLSQWALMQASMVKDLKKIHQRRSLWENRRPLLFIKPLNSAHSPATTRETSSSSR